MEIIKPGIYEGERALYDIHNCLICDSIFQNGESPLKECSSLEIRNVEFRWKYPLWYDKDVKVYNSTFLETARSGIWYTNNLEIRDCKIDAPKLFRRCRGVSIYNSNINFAQETFWKCEDVYLEKVYAKGDYFCFNCSNVEIKDFHLDGNYAFDGASNVKISHAILNSKDSFWNCKNVEVRDSKIVGEYLAWNSENITFINCEISSHQGLCYMKNIKLINCKLIDTDLCFEFCEDVDAEITNVVHSIKNPYSGVIRCVGVGELILDEKYINKEKIQIITE